MASTVRNGVPILEQTLAMLAVLERQPDGTSIRELIAELGLPRSTVYRILNTLLAHNYVRRTADGVFSLGPRIASLASRVRTDTGYDLAELALPVLNRLRDVTGEPAKLSVRDGDRARVIAAVLGRHEYSLSPSTGTSYPLHAGAASKMILAYLPQAELEAQLAAPLTRYTPKTLIEPDRLRADLARIRRQNFAQDLGEHNITVHAMAAPVFDGAGKFLAAVSIPFLVGKDAAERDRMKAGIIAAAAELTSAIPKL
ncbi:MAG: rhmR [Devosia sp.]|nr:rhmR [Devosia sp.]